MHAEYRNDQIAHAESLPDGRLITGSVLLIALILMNVILLLNWFGYVSIN